MLTKGVSVPTRSLALKSDQLQVAVCQPGQNKSRQKTPLCNCTSLNKVQRVCLQRSFKKQLAIKWLGFFSPFCIFANLHLQLFRVLRKNVRISTVNTIFSREFEINQHTYCKVILFPLRKIRQKLCSIREKKTQR